MKGALFAIAFVLVLGTFLLAPGQMFKQMPIDDALPLALWWVSPLSIYVLFCRSRRGTLIVGTAFICAIGAILTSIYTSESSTVGIGLFTVPILLWIGMAVGVAAETLIGARIRHRNR